MLQLNAFLTTVYPVIEWETVINGLYGPLKVRFMVPWVEQEQEGGMGKVRDLRQVMRSEPDISFQSWVEPVPRGIRQTSLLS